MWKSIANFICLLYTSDAADERSSVDLGGRRIIKKKKDCVVVWQQYVEHTLYYIVSDKMMQEDSKAKIRS